MPTHLWGDLTFDWVSLHESMKFIQKRCKRYANLNVMMKEKWGCVRFEMEHTWGWSKYSVVRKYQIWVFRSTVYKATKKYPHIRREIMDDMWFMF